MNRIFSSTVLRTASVLLFMSPLSCASAANYVLTGRWEDPSAEEAPAPPKESPAPPKEVAPIPADVVEKKEEPAKPMAEPLVVATETPKPDPFDGCTRADGTLPVFLGIGVQMGKKTCGLSLTADENEATLTQGNLVIRFKTLSILPDIDKARANAEKGRQIAAKNKGRLEVSVVGDATYTLISARATKSTGEVFALVESDRIIDDQSFRCQAKLEGPDAALQATAKKICASMRAVK